MPVRLRFVGTVKSSDSRVAPDLRPTSHWWNANYALSGCSFVQGVLAMKIHRTHRAKVAALMTLALMLGMGVGWARQEPGPGEKAGGKLDEAGKSIKRGLQEAGEAIREQFAKVRDSVHNMGVMTRVYGRLHWDKALTSSA